jgi:hypothetical protein
MGIVSASKAALGNYVWIDANGNGRQDATEQGVGGVTVTLYDGTNTPISSAVTDASGFYMFPNLDPGIYSVGFTNIPANTSFTTQNASGTTNANNSDVNPATGITSTVTLAAGTVNLDVDAGLIANFAAVGDFVWYDKNVNGRQDANELPVPGVTVMLYNASGVLVASAVTDGNGRYFINNIPVGSAGSVFSIDFNDNNDLPANTVGFTIQNAVIATPATNSDASPATGRTAPFTLLPGQVNLTIDAGIITIQNEILPVTFTKLTGVYSNGISKLSWATMSEQNFSHFEVEHSTDGVNFNYVGKVNGTNTNNRVDYTFDHKQPVAGANYYRVKIVDRDGRFVYSNVVLLNVSVKGINITAVYPSPFIDRINISVVAEKAGDLTISLFDNAGKLVLSQQENVARGTSVLTVNNLAKLARGGYVIEVRTGDTVLTKQLIK